MAVQCSVHAQGTVGGLIPRVLGIQCGDFLLSPQCVQSDSLVVCWELSHCTLGFPSCPISRSLARTSLGQCFYSPCLLPLTWPLIFLAPSIRAAGLSSAALSGALLCVLAESGSQVILEFSGNRITYSPFPKCLHVQIAPVFQRLRSETTSFQEAFLPLDTHSILSLLLSWLCYLLAVWPWGSFLTSLCQFLVCKMKIITAHNLIALKHLE